jgi:methionyl-tRNA formyltransferase
MGSPAFAVPSLIALRNNGVNIARIYTQPPRPAGRGQKLTPTAVHSAALAFGYPETQVFTPLKLRDEGRDEVLTDLLAHPCQTLVVVAYGLLLPKALTEAKTCINIHPSMLPRWRGPAPLQHTLLAGDEATEVCIMQLDEGMDTGPVYSRTPLPVPPDMTYGALHDYTAAIGAEELIKVLNALPTLTPIPQTGEATLAPKILPQHRALDFTQTADQLHNQIRALSPSPSATWAIHNEVLKVLKSEVSPQTHTTAPSTVLGMEGPAVLVSCGAGTTLKLLGLQRPGREKGPAADIWRGLVG